MALQPLISIVDDDDSVRESLAGLLKSAGFRVAAFASAEQFLAEEDPAGTGCLILDVRLRGMSGPELQRELTAAGRALPTLFITAHGDDTLRARVMGRGAVDCLRKPFTGEELLTAVERISRLMPAPASSTPPFYPS